jgi:hypothetical protein
MKMMMTKVRMMKIRSGSAILTVSSFNICMICRTISRLTSLELLVSRAVSLIC